MGDLKETQEVFKKGLHFPNADALFAHLDREVANFRENDATDLIPHQVLSHGFMEWQDILFSQFPCFAWRGEKAETDQNITSEEYRRFLYNRFFLQIAELPSLANMSEEEKAKLKEEGWKEYLED
jgi:hypothetical protein